MPAAVLISSKFFSKMVKQQIDTISLCAGVGMCVWGEAGDCF